MRRWVFALVPTLLATAQAMADVTRGDPPKEKGGIEILSGGPFQLTCWQNGVKIVDEPNLTDLSLAPAEAFRSLRATARGGGQTVLFSSNIYTTCLLKRQ